MEGQFIRLVATPSQVLVRSEARTDGGGDTMWTAAGPLLDQCGRRLDPYVLWTKSIAATSCEWIWDII